MPTAYPRGESLDGRWFSIMTIKRKSYQKHTFSRKKKACFRRCYCKLNCQCYFQQHHRDSKEKSPHNHFGTDVWDTATQCNRKVLSLHRESGSSHSKTEGPRALSRVTWSRVGARVASRAKQVSSLKKPRIWYAGDHWLALQKDKHHLI